MTTSVNLLSDTIRFKMA